MRTFNRPRIISALLGASICLPVAASAQSQDAQSSQSTSESSSVADAARRSRDKKKNPSTTSKSTKVITDDDLAQRNYQPGPDVLNLGASANQERIPGSTEAAAGEAAEQDAKEAKEPDANEQDAEIGKLKLQVTEAEKDLDLARRQLALDQDTHFANPEYAHDVAGKAKLDAEKQQVDDKQQEVERLKSRLAALEELKGHRKPGQTQPTPRPTKPTPPPQSEQPENPPL
jgi:hypothetical protein